MKNGDQHNGKSEVSTTLSSTVSDNKSTRCRTSANVNTSGSPPVSFLQAAHDGQEAISFACVFGTTITCCNFLQCSPHALHSLSLTTTFQTGTKWKLGTELLAETSSSIAGSRWSLATLLPNGKVIPTSFSVELNYLNNE